MPDPVDSEGVLAGGGSDTHQLGIKDGSGDEHDYDDISDEAPNDNLNGNNDVDNGCGGNGGDFGGNEIGDVEEPLAVRGHRRQVSVQTHPDDYIRMMSLQYKAVMAEINLMTDDISKSADFVMISVLIHTRKYLLRGFP